MTPKRYHTALVLLHWLLAFLILLELGLGSTFLTHFSNDMPEKLLALRNHMAAGGLILILTIIRFIVRLKTKHPAPASVGNAVLNRPAVFAHYGLYLLTVLMATSGFVLAVQADLPAVVFEGVGSLPTDFSGFDSRIAHGWIAKCLIALIAVHVLAAFYHQFIRKDGLLGRMGFGRE